MCVAEIFQLKESDHLADLWIDIKVILLMLRNRLWDCGLVSSGSR